MAGTYKIDDRGQKALMRHYEPKKLDRIFLAAARAGAKAGAEVLQGAAPIGASERLSSIYRTGDMGHGALKASVAARKIRKRRLNKGVIGFVMGPAGKGGVARHWITGGTRPHGGHPGTRGNPWLDRAAPAANDAARKASEAVILRYVRKLSRGR